MKTENARSILCVLVAAMWLETKAAQQALREPSPSETDLITGGRFTRTFALNPNALLQDLSGSDQIVVARENRSIEERVREYFQSAGINLGEDNAPRFFFNERTGILTVEGTIPQLEAVKNALRSLTSKPAQVAIEVRLLETTSNTGNARMKMLLPQFEADDFVLPSALPVAAAEADRALLRTAVLTHNEFTKLLRSAEQSEGIDLLSAPRTVTLSGRQARIAVENSFQTVTDPPMLGGRRIKLNAE